MWSGVLRGTLTGGTGGRWRGGKGRGRGQLWEIELMTWDLLQLVPEVAFDALFHIVIHHLSTWVQEKMPNWKPLPLSSSITF